MSKELELWYRIVEYLESTSQDIRVKETQECDGYIAQFEGYPISIIETALKDYENLQYIFKLLNEYNNKNYSLEDLIKKAKALEVIKEKGLSLLHKSLIISSTSYEEYRQEFQLVRSREFKNEYFYTKEEFDLLKEVLL